VREAALPDTSGSSSSWTASGNGSTGTEGTDGRAPLFPLLHRKQVPGVAGVREKVDVGPSRPGAGRVVPRLPFGVALLGLRVQPQRLVVGVLFVLRVACRTGRAGVPAGAGLLAGLGAAPIDGARGRGLPAGYHDRALVLALSLFAGLLLGLLGGLVLGSARVLLGVALVLPVLVPLFAFGVRGVLAFAGGVLLGVPAGGVLVLPLVPRALLLVLGGLLPPRGRARAALGVLPADVAGGGSSALLPGLYPASAGRGPAVLRVPARPAGPGRPGLLRGALGLGVLAGALLPDLLRRTGDSQRGRRGIQRQRPGPLRLLHTLQQPVEHRRGEPQFQPVEDAVLHLGRHAGQLDPDAARPVLRVAAQGTQEAVREAVDEGRGAQLFHAAAVGVDGRVAQPAGGGLCLVEVRGPVPPGFGVAYQVRCRRLGLPFDRLLRQAHHSRQHNGRRSWAPAPVRRRAARDHARRP
jgi:hypothetical protein